MIKIFYRIFIKIQQTLFPHYLPDIKILLWSRAVSLIGTILSSYAISLYIYHQTQDPQLMTFQLLASAIGGVVSGFGLSAIADYYSPKRIMIFAEILGAFVTFSLIFIDFKQAPFFLFSALFFLGLSHVLFTSASSSLLSKLSSDEDLQRKIAAQFQIVNGLLYALDPLVCGFLLVLVPIQKLLIVDAMSYIVSALFLTKLVVKVEAQKSPFYLTQWWKKQFIEPLTYLQKHREKSVIFCVTFLCYIASAIANAIYIYHLKHVLVGSDLSLSWLLGFAFGAGVLGSFFGTKLKAARFWIIAIMYGIDGLAYVAIGYAPNVALFIFAYCINDFVTAIYTVFVIGYLHTFFAKDLVGRMRGLLLSLNKLSTIFGIGVAYFLLPTQSTTHLYLLAAAFIFGASLIAYFVYLNYEKKTYVKATLP